MSWFKNWIKNIAKNWLRRNKQEVVYIFDDFTNEITVSVEQKIKEKYPHMPVDMQAVMKEIFIMIDDEVDNKFEDFINNLIDKLGESKNVSSSNGSSE